MNSEGASSPRSGCSHLTRASKPITSPGLIVNPELSAPYRLSQIFLEPQASERVVHPRGEDLVAVLALALAPVHGDIRSSHELLGVVLAGLAGGSHHDPDACGHDRLVAIHLEGGAQVLFDPFCDVGGVTDVFEVFEQHSELVTTEARDRVPEAYPGRDTFGHPHQELVARVVAQGVVEALEVVEVHV